MSDTGANGKEKGDAPLQRAFHLLGSAFGSRMHLILIYCAAFIVISLILFPPIRKAKDIRFREGDIADIDVIAPFTFFVPLSEQEYENNRDNAAVKVPPVYREQAEVAALLPENLEVFMKNIADIASIDSLSTEERVERIREMAPSLKKEPVDLLLGRSMRERILRNGARIQKDFFTRGIVNDFSPLRRGSYPRITVLTDASEKSVQTSSLITQGDLQNMILDEAGRIFGGNEEAVKIFYTIVRSHIMPNLVYDMEETKRRRDDAVHNVPKSFKVLEDERIIAKHDKVTEKQVAMLQALETRRVELELETSIWKRLLLFISKTLRIIVLIGLLGLAVNRLRPDLLADREKLTLIFIMLTFYVVLTALVTRIPHLDPRLIPVAFVSLVSAAFFGIMTSVMFTLFASFAIVTHTDLGASHAFIGVMAGTAGIISIAQLRERRNFYTIFLYITIANIIGAFAFGATEGITVGEFLMQALWGITNAFVCTILVMFLLPIFESLFNVTTNFTLMEASDLNRPLLRRLVLEAPGTYHHSLMVGNLVEAVAADVNANSLLARVMAYYHDIGKLAKPEYFFENKGDEVNKHERLTATMSALILASHVKEGIELAKKEKLPNVIIDAIREHHGTTVMAYFYQKALEYDSHDSVNIDDFRYPGPRPRSKETALIMLADSSEAAVRSLKEPTAPRIRALVTKIIEARMNDGELESSGLTLNDIAVIREKFIQLLTGIFHPRVQYPEQEEPGKRQENENSFKQQVKSERKGRI
jgi:putative nucleotidyltransferase with HDIG domain